MNKVQRILNKWQPRRFRNLLKNGDFLNGSKGWNVVGSTFAVNSNVLELLSSITGGHIRQNCGLGDTGDKFYVAVKVKSTSNSVKVQCYDGIEITDLFHTGSGDYELLSLIHTQTASADQITPYVKDHRYSDYDTVYIKNCICINLTELELEDKDQAWCDKYIAPNIDYWGWMGQFMNELRNGDFREGVLGWNLSGNATYSVSNGKLSITATSDDSEHYSLVPFEPELNNIYYASALPVSSLNGARFNILLGNQKVDDTYESSNTWGNIGEVTSCLFTPTSIKEIPNCFLRLNVKEFDSSSTYPGNGECVTVKDVVLLNLTKIFGAGNEPDKSFCDTVLRPLVNFARVMNKFTNGNFETTNNWTLNNGGSVSVSNNKYVINTDILNPAMGIWQSQQLIKGHKYYISCDFNVPYNNAVKIHSSALGEQLSIVIPTNTWERVSCVVDSSVDVISPVVFHTSCNTQYTITDSFKLKNVIYLDLTALFGISNEPSKEFVDAFIADYINY